MGKLKTLIAENIKSLSVEFGKLIKNAEIAQSLQNEIFEAGPPIQLFKEELSRKLQRLRPSIGRISFLAIWNAIKSDRAQRDILVAAVEVGLINGASQHLADEIAWICHRDILLDGMIELICNSFEAPRFENTP